MLIFLWGALSLGDGSEAPRELVGLPLTDLEMGDAYSELSGGRLLRVCSPATHRDNAGSPRKEGLVGKERKGRAPKTSSVDDYNQQRSPEV